MSRENLFREPGEPSAAEPSAEPPADDEPAARPQQVAFNGPPDDETD